MRFVRSAIALVAAVAFAASSHAQLQKFDFGPAGAPTAEGYQLVTPLSAYTDAAGFGWATKLRVVPSEPNWWNPKEAGGILSANDPGKGAPPGRAFVFGFHFFGWPHTAEDKDGVNRLGIKMDDDLKTDFVVKVKPGKYSLLVGMGDVNVSHRIRPFSVEANGVSVARNLSCQTLTYKRASNIDCPDGKLVVTFRGDTGYKHPYPWNQCTWWMVNMVLVAPADQEGEIDKEMNRLIPLRLDWFKKNLVPAGEPPRFEILDGPGRYLAKDGKPFLRLLWHGWGWEDTLKYYRLYAWTNTINLGGGNHQLFYYDDWFRDGWRERAAVEAFPTDWFEQMNKLYPYGYLANYYLGRDYMQYLPPSYRAQHPESVALDFAGKPEGGVRYPGEPGGDVYTSRMMTVLADLAKMHPASGTVELFEEYWVPVNGLNPEAVAEYRAWLKERFGTIDKLNAEWGANYNDFADITPPKKPDERSGNGICHYVWRGQMAARAAKVAYDAIKSADPSRPVAGAKGTFPIASWYYAPPTDIFGWYGHADMAIAEAACREFGKLQEPVHVNICQHQTMRGGVPVDKWPFMNYRESAYSLMLTRVIDGAKSIFNEDYVLGHDFHYFHMTKEMRGKDLQGTLGGKVMIDRDDYPDVYMEAKSLQLARANQLLLRLAPVFLPMKRPHAKVAVLATEAADSHGGPSAYYSNTTMSTVYLLKMCHVPFDVLREPQFAKMGEYDAVVLTPLCDALRPEAVQEIKDFVAKGGKLLILPPTANTDARNLQPLAFPWEELAGCKPGPAVDQGPENAITVDSEESARRLTAAETLPGFSKKTSGRLASLEMKGGETLAHVGGAPVVARSKDGRVVTASIPQMCPSWGGDATEHFDARTAKFFGKVFDDWKLVNPVDITGAGETHMIDVGVLEGNREWLLFLASYSKEEQIVRAKLNFLPEGKYYLVKVTGERPIIEKDAAGQNHLVNDRCPSPILATTSDYGRKNGLILQVGPQMGEVWLIRPEQEDVWVNCPAHELATLAKKPVWIVPAADTPVEMITAIRNRLEATGTRDIAVKTPAEIKSRAVKNEVVIKDFKVDEFNSSPLDENTNLILIGNEATNPVIAKLGAAGTFCFDKVLMKVDAGFPGAGKGVIEVVESVSNEAYDATTNSRDAIILAGSDAEGTKRAVERFIEILGAK